MTIAFCTDCRLRTDATPEGLERVCAFTLATALVWLGHDCAGGCPPLILTLHARTWIDRPTPRPAGDSTTLAIVDFDDTLQRAVVTGMLRAVNACTYTDHIRVQERALTSQPHANIDHPDVVRLVVAVMQRPPTHDPHATVLT